jgi:hypothetical protein
MRKVFLALAVICFCAPSFGQGTRTPKFRDYKVDEPIYTGEHAPVRLKGELGKHYPTRLKRGAQSPVNFAGHYILSLWGCGGQCLMGGIIDAKTGEVCELDFTICCWSNVKQDSDGVYFRTDSSLIVFVGSRGEDDDPQTHYYNFQNGKLVHLMSVKPPKTDESAISGETPSPKTSECTTQDIQLHGFRLGMSLDEVKRRFPQKKDWIETVDETGCADQNVFSSQSPRLTVWSGFCSYPKLPQKSPKTPPIIV